MKIEVKKLRALIWSLFNQNDVKFKKHINFADKIIKMKLQKCDVVGGSSFNLWQGVANKHVDIAESLI